MIQIRKEIILKLLIISIFGLVILAVIPFSVYAEELPEKDSEIQNTWNPEEGSYVISTVEDLKAFRESLNTGETYYSERQVDGQTIREQTVVTLANDIVIPEGADIGTITKYTDKVSQKNATNFEGYFNGHGHTISGFADDKAGLVDYLGYNGVITNLNIVVDIQFDNDSFYETEDGIGRKHLSIDYGVVCTNGEGQIKCCSVKGDVSFLYDLKVGDNVLGKGATFYGIRSPNMYSGKPIDWLLCSDCYTSLNYNVKNDLELDSTHIYGLTECYSTRSSWRGALLNCYSSGSITWSVTDENNKPVEKNAYAIGRLQSKEFVENIYYDKTSWGKTLDESETVLNNPGLRTPIDNKGDLFKASTYKGFDFENIWTTNGDTTMPEMRKDIPDEMLLPVIDDGGIKGDVNGDDKVDAKDATRIAQYITGTRPFTEIEKKLADVNGDGEVNAKDRTKIQQYIVGMDEAL